MRPVRLIGLAGAGGAGKSKAARELAVMGFAPVVIGDPLKAAFSALLAALGIPPAEVQRMAEGDLKRTPCAALGGRTPTEAMQSLGTDWGRGMIDPDLWVRPARARLEAALAGGGRVVCEAVRFDNEGQMIKDLGGEVWRVVGRGNMSISEAGHISEQYAGPVDRILLNAGTGQDLRAALDRALDGR